MKYNNVWHVPFATPNKLLDALVTKVELNTFFDATNTPSKVNTPIGLGTMDVNTNDRGRQTWCYASPCWRFNFSSIPYGFDCWTFILIINVDVKNILRDLETLTCFPSSCFPNTFNIVSFGAIELENSVPQNILVDISIKRWGVFSILHFHWPKCIGFHLGCRVHNLSF